MIREYNKSDLYALFVGNLADRIRGGGGFSQPWQRIVQAPTADVEFMQKRLTSLGLYGDTIDGKAGGRTRAPSPLSEALHPTANMLAYG